MKYFVLLLDMNGQGVDDALRHRHESLALARGLDTVWQQFPSATCLLAYDTDRRSPKIVYDEACLAVGTVRLDNRLELAHTRGLPTLDDDDLDLVARDVCRHGTSNVASYVGDFGFVVWDWSRRWGLAASDAFGLQKVYYRLHGNVVGLSSRAEALALEEQYDTQYLAELVANCIPSAGHCVYAKVKPVPNGCLAVIDRGELTLSQFWSAEAIDLNPRWARAEQEAAAMCRHLLGESVRLRLAGSEGLAWAQLSGGLDSSSVVSVAQWLAANGHSPHGLTATVTYVDRKASEADERLFSNAVATRWRLRNALVMECPLWYDDDAPPPRTDQPRMDYPFYRREQALCAVVKGEGGTRILTGIGGDELFTGFMYFFADWLAKGRGVDAIREMVHRASLGRGSFWTLAYENALLPLLPASLRRRLVRAGGHVPPWVRRDAVRRYALDDRTFSAAFYAGPLGQKYRHGVLTSLLGLGRLIEPGTMGDSLDVYHPFLYRPLVEFALALPPELCARPHQRKWVLREAMRGILPEEVRARVGKGSPSELYAWSLVALRPLLEPLVRHSILAELGVLDLSRLQRAFDEVPRHAHHVDQRHTMLYATLATEAWLQVRASRWPRGEVRRTGNVVHS